MKFDLVMELTQIFKIIMLWRKRKINKICKSRGRYYWIELFLKIEHSTHLVYFTKHFEKFSNKPSLLIWTWFHTTNCQILVVAIARLFGHNFLHVILAICIKHTKEAKQHNTKWKRGNLLRKRKTRPKARSERIS